jgi:cell division protein FtsW (lipid II flippase)
VPPTKGTAIARGSAVGAVFGTAALAVVVMVAHLWLQMGVTVSGVLALAIPLVVLPSICGAILGRQSTADQRSGRTAAEKGAMLYLGAFMILWLGIAALVVVVQPRLGESFLALPVLLLLCLFVGAPTTAVAAIFIRRLGLQAEIPDVA